MDKQYKLELNEYDDDFFFKESAILRKVFIIFNEDDLSSKIYLFSVLPLFSFNSLCCLNPQLWVTSCNIYIFQPLSGKD